MNVEFEGRTYQFPDDATPDEIKGVLEGASAKPQEFVAPTAADAVLGGFKRLGRGAAGVGEAALHMASGAVATPVAGWLGIGSAVTGMGTPGDVVRGVQNKFTYKPRTQEGQAVSDVIGLPGTLYNKTADWITDKARGEDWSGGPRDLAATTLNVALKGAPVVYGGIKSLQAARAARPELTVKEQTLKDAQDLGYVTTPESMGRKSLVSGIAGRARSRQGMSERNQVISNEVVVRDLNSSMQRAEMQPLPVGTELTPKILEQVRDKAGESYAAVTNVPGKFSIDQGLRTDAGNLMKIADEVQGSFPAAKLSAYNDIAALSKSLTSSPGGFTAGAAVNYIKILRNDAKANLNRVNMTPDSYALGTAQRAAADALESALERGLEAGGHTGLVDKMVRAREVIAKTHTFEDALNIGSADISMARLSKAPYVGPELEKAVKFYDAFHKVNQNPANFEGPQLASPLDTAVAVGSALAGGAMGSPALGGLGTGMVGLRSIALPLLMSKRYQAGLIGTTPSPALLPLTPGLIESAALADERGIMGRR